MSALYVRVVEIASQVFVSCIIHFYTAPRPLLQFSPKLGNSNLARFWLFLHEQSTPVSSSLHCTNWSHRYHRSVVVVL